MNEQPDKFFREKLYDYERPVSANAWRRIAKNRKTRNHRWLGIAAAMLLLSVAGILLFSIDTKQPERVVAENGESTGERKSDNNIRIPDEPLSQKTPDETASPTYTGAGDIVKKKVDKKQNIAPEKNTSPGQLAVVTEPSVPPLGEMKAEAIHDTAEHGDQEVIASPLSDNQGRRTVTIIFNADEVNEKYFNKKTVAEATSPAKEASTLKKLLDKAYDLKHNQDPLGEIRQKKNKILALNFRGEKQRNAN